MQRVKAAWFDQPGCRSNVSMPPRRLVAGVSLLLLRGQGLHGHSGADLLKAACDDLVLGLDAVQDSDLLALDRSERNLTHLDFAAFAYNVEILAQLAGTHRHLRHHQRAGLLTDQHVRPDVLARQQLEVFVRHRVFVALAEKADIVGISNENVIFIHGIDVFSIVCRLVNVNLDWKATFMGTN